LFLADAECCTHARSSFPVQGNFYLKLVSVQLHLLLVYDIHPFYAKICPINIFFWGRRTLVRWKGYLVFGWRSQFWVDVVNFLDACEVSATASIAVA